MGRASCAPPIVSLAAAQAAEPASIKLVRTLRRALGRADDNFAESASLTDASQSGGNLIEAEPAVDVDPYLAGSAEVSNGLEVGRPLLHGEHAH